MVEIDEIGVVGTEQKGPAQIAVEIAQASQAKINPVRDVLVVLRYSDERLAVTFSTMSTADLSELMKYVEVRGNAILDACWEDDEMIETEEDAS